MKTFPPFHVLIAGAMACWLSTATLTAKPPTASPKKSSPEPSPTASPASVADTAASPLARWLMQQNGGKDAISLSLAEAVHAATGRNIIPIDAANPVDAAVVVKLGNVMDRVLPGMNKPESPAHVVGRLDEVTAFFEDAVRAFVGTVPGLSCSSGPDESTATTHTAGAFPAFRVLDTASGKSFYLGVALYPTGGREAALCALHFHPADAAARMTDDGACLLVAIEHNGKIGKEIAFLNWELLDLTKLSLRVVTTFEATEGDVHPPGAVLNDGRKGRD